MLVVAVGEFLGFLLATFRFGIELVQHVFYGLPLVTLLEVDPKRVVLEPFPIVALLEPVPQAFQEVERGVEMLVLADELVVGANVPVDDTDLFRRKRFETLR